MCFMQPCTSSLNVSTLQQLQEQKLSSPGITEWPACFSALNCWRKRVRTHAKGGMFHFAIYWKIWKERNNRVFNSFANLLDILECKLTR